MADTIFTSLPEQVQSDFESLLQIEIPSAQKILAAQGSFFPFGAMIKSDGDFSLYGSHPGEASLHLGQAHIGTIILFFKEQAEARFIRACCFCTDVRLQNPGQLEKTDAILINLELSIGHFINIFVPYQKQFLRGYVYGPQYAQSTVPKVFVDPLANAA
jgi:hypothetical protein